MSVDVAEYVARFMGDDSNFQASATRVERTLGSLDRAFDQTAVRIGNLGRELGAIGNVVGTMTTGANGLATAIRTLGTSLTPTTVSAYATALGEVAAAMTSVNRRWPAFNGGLVTATDALLRVSPAAQAATGEIRTLAAEVARLRAMSNIRINVSGGVGGAGGGGGMSRLERFGNLSGRYATGIGLPAAALGTMAAIAAAKFETAQARVESFAGATHAEMEKLKPTIMAMGEQFGVMPEELEKGFFHIRSSISNTKTALDVLNVSTKASAAGLGSLEDVAYAITSAKYSFGGSAQAIGDVVAKAAVLSHADPSAFFKNMGQAIPIAATLGIKLKDISGLVAIMTREGLSPAKGFQRITAMMDAASKPTDQMKKVAASMGMDFGSFRKHMSEDMMGALDEVLIKSQGKLEKIRNFFGPRRAGDAALAFFNPNARDDNHAVMSGMGNSAGTVQHAWEVAAKTVGVQWKQAMVAVNEAMISVGDAVAPTVHSIAGWVKSVADGLKGWSPEMKNFLVVGGLVVGVTGLIASAFSKIALTLSLIRTGAGLLGVASATTAAGTAAGGAAVGFGALTIAALPWIAAAAAILGGTYLIVRAYQALNPTIEDQRAALKAENVEHVKAVKAKFDHAVQVRHLYDEIKILGDKHHRTAEEAQTMRDKLEELRKLNPELIGGYNRQGEAISILAGQYQNLTDKINESARAGFNASIQQRTDTVTRPAVENYAAAQEKLADLQRQHRDVIRKVDADPSYRDQVKGVLEDIEGQIRTAIVERNRAKELMNEALRASKAGYKGDVKDLNNKLHGKIGSGVVSNTTTGGNGTKLPGLDTQYTEPPKERKGRKPPETEEEKAIKRLDAALEDMAVRYKEGAKESEYARTKHELLFGTFASGEKKAAALKERLHDLYKNHMPALEKASMDIYGTHFSTKTSRVDPKNPLFGRIFSNTGEDGDYSEHQKGVMLAVGNKLKEEETAAHAVSKKFNEQVAAFRKASEKGSSKAEYGKDSREAIVAEFFPDASFLSMYNTKTHPEFVKMVDKLYNDRVDAAVEAAKRASISLSARTVSLNDIAQKRYGADYDKIDDPRNPNDRRKRDQVDKELSDDLTRQTTADFKKQGDEVERYKDRFAKAMFFIKKEKADALNRTRDADREDYVQSRLQSMPEIGPMGGWAAQLGELLRARAKITAAANETFDAIQSAKYMKNYESSIRSARKEIMEYGRMTDAAKVSMVEFDEEGVRRMTHDQAALVVATQKTADKFKEMAEQMKKLATTATDSIGNIVKDVFDKGFSGLYGRIMLETKNMIQGILIELMKANIQKYLTNLLMPKQGATATSGGGLFGIIAGLPGLVGSMQASGRGIQSPNSLTPFFHSTGGSYNYGEPKFTGGGGVEVDVPRHGGSIVPNYEIAKKMGRGDTHNHITIVLPEGAQADKQTMTQSAHEVHRQLGALSNRVR